MIFRRFRKPAGLACQELVELVTAYLEDELPAGERRRIDAHLRACDGCTAYLEQMRAMLAELGELTLDALPDSAVRELSAAFAAARPD